ncbi:hypothetical protein LZ31DRAFT_540667 [Colletotrichum somersetense]|nr:hypothetical protein LZ31DRAFT_540667 [Colletotrichum somersetense]
MNAIRLAQVATAAEGLWALCAARPTYAPYYFTFVPAVGTFLRETEYIVSHIANFPSISKLGLGQVNIHRDVLRSVLALTAAAYGGLHLIGWFEHFLTQVEQRMWLVSSLAIACSRIALWIFSLARQAYPWFDVFVSGAAPGHD